MSEACSREVKHLHKSFIGQTEDLFEHSVLIFYPGVTAMQTDYLIYFRHFFPNNLTKRARQSL